MSRLTREELIELAQWHQSQAQQIYWAMLNGLAPTKPPELILLPAPKRGGRERRIQ